MHWRCRIMIRLFQPLARLRPSLILFVLLLLATTNRSARCQTPTADYSVRIRENTAKLADPRKLTDADAAKLVGEGKPFYWASGSIHSTETGSPEMLMELAYRLAVEDSPIIEAIRKNVIVMITPALEVDGRDRAVDQYYYRKANPSKPVSPLLYWGKYVAHDNNRDG